MMKFIGCDSTWDQKEKRLTISRSWIPVFEIVADNEILARKLAMCVVGAIEKSKWEQAMDLINS